MGPSLGDEVVALVNEERWNNGQLPPLKRQALLDLSAQVHSNNMAERDFFAHCDPDTGEQPWERMTDVGYSWNFAGENIAAGYGSAASVMEGWMNSSGHRANILSTDFREIGVGYDYQANDLANVRQDADSDCAVDSVGNGPYYHYWTQNFGTRSSVYPLVINRESFETDTRQVDLYIYGTGWATQMRIRNEADVFTAWQPFAANVSWELSAGNGTKEVFVELKNSSGSTTSASDAIELNLIEEPPQDTDSDGVPDTTDNCLLGSNADQANADGDPLGDICDPDDDNDGIADWADPSPLDTDVGSSPVYAADTAAPGQP